ncbi:hypothetical protein AAG570_000395 [Ranatra chinensis]|uniref:RGS domain-containing protein n=1 Tax=Ranatra chinensis TaxID=642074 RepID=A0ABD0YWX3_9HEMI
MLQFWKKEKQKSPLSSPSKLQNGNTLSGASNSEEQVFLGPLSSFKHDSLNRPPCERKSRLSLELEDVLNNKIALSYFSQYMESRGYTNILSLWLDLEQVPFSLHTYSHKRLYSVFNSPSKSTPQGGNDKASEGHVGSARLIKLLRTYFNDDAPFRVRVPEELRLEIQEKVNKEASVDCLTRLKDHLIYTMKKE